MRPIRKSSVLLLTLCGIAGLGGASAADSTAIGRSFSDPALQWNECPGFMPDGCGIAILHGDPTGDDADVFFRVPGGSEVPLHWHSAAERMALVSGRMTVTFEGQAPLTMTAGSYAYGPARLPHSATCESDESCVLFIAFDAPVDAHAGRPAP